MTSMSPNYSYLEQLPVQAVSAFSPDALHVLGCQPAATLSDTGDRDVQLLATDLPANIITALQSEIKACGWQAKRDSLHVVADGVRFLLVPTNTRTTSTTQAFRQVGLQAAHRLSKMSIAKLTICSNAALAVFDGLIMGLYKHKFNAKPLRLPAEIAIFTPKPSSIAAAIHKHRALALAITYARSLQDLPPNYLHAPRLASIVQEISTKHNLACEVHDQEQLQKLGMGALLAVAQGAQHEPRMLALKVQGKSKRLVVLVGKGITFDTGGMDLKRRDMEEMKYDMSGAAAVLGAMHYFAQVQPDATVVGIVGAAENAISSQATRPSDIITAYNGKSIEILDTDAEGRLLLADLLAYAAKVYQPDLLVNIATLTGSVAYALGRVGAGFYSNSESAAELLLRASARAGEPFCQLPIWDEVQEMVASKHADWVNIDATHTESDGMFAAGFLHKFSAACEWLHLDIAGTASDCRATGFPSKGGCAYGLRTFVELCADSTGIVA
ncbi:MAG: aminopeptidase [Pseudomonadota bacterium]|nr:aminopeptidase [Pseudomonadota bacterium]